jgi:hypothetical protein
VSIGKSHANGAWCPDGSQPMSKLPAFQFYPGDWRKDMGVQSLSFHDRGVWWEMLCLMHESERRGVLVLNGTAMTEETLSRLLGLDKQITTTTITNILAVGVASREEDTGAIYCRRMVKDEKIRQVRSIAGKQGGNPLLVKQNKRPDLLKQITTTGVKQITTPSPSPSGKKRVPAVALPDWLPEPLWFEYEDMRKKKRATMTDPVRFRIIQRLTEFKENGSDPLVSLEASIRNSWTDVYERDKDGGKSNGRGSGKSESVLDTVQRERAKTSTNGVGGHAAPRTAQPAGEPAPGEVVGESTGTIW